MASEAFEKWLEDNPAGQWACEHAALAWDESRRQAVEECAAEVEAAFKESVNAPGPVVLMARLRRLA